MFPYRDENVALRTPVVTFLVIAANVAAWFLVQGEAGGGVAFWAHVGGLIAGIVLVRLFARSDYIEEHRSQQWAPKRLGWR